MIKTKHDFLGKNRIWQKDNTYCYTLPDGTYKQFNKEISYDALRRAFSKVSYYNEYKNRVKENGTKYGVLDKISMYPFAMPLNTWIFTALDYNVENFIPSFEEFCTFYRDNYCHAQGDMFTFNYNACEENAIFTDCALRVRIGYAYGSFLRELYIRIMLKKYFERKNAGIEVCYDLNDDYFNATDIILIKDNKKLGVCVLDASKNSKNMKNAKDTNRHQVRENIVRITNHNGIIGNDEYLSRMNFYTDIWEGDVDTLGDIKVPAISRIMEFGDKVIEWFEDVEKVA